MTTAPRVILYCEFLKHFDGKTIGFIASYHNQKKLLAAQGVPFTEDLNADADIFQCNAQGPRSLLLLKRAKRRGMKTIIYAHAAAEELPGSFWALGLLVPLYRRYLSHIYNLADAVICVSEYNRSQLIKLYRVPPEKAHFISNGVDVDRFRPDAERRRAFRAAHAIPAGATLAIDVAMAIRKKGTETFIQVAKAFPDVLFRWYGRVFASFMAPAPKPRSKNLEFSGYVSAVEDAYAAADIFIFPSYEENQGMVVLEAMACGLPVIVRDIAVYDGWLKHGENCLKAVRDDQFGVQLHALLTDAKLRADITGAGQKMVLAEHSLDAVGKKLVGLYAELLK